MDQGHAGCRVTHVGSNWTLGQLLRQDIHNTIENTWWHEEMLERVAFIIFFKGLDVVQKAQTQVLLQMSVFELIVQDVFFDLFNTPSRHVLIGQASFFGCRDSVQIVCDAETFFPSHNSESLVSSVIFCLNFAETFPWEHTSPVGIWENGVAADVLEVLGCNALTIAGLDHVGQLNCGLLGRWLLIID